MIMESSEILPKSVQDTEILSDTTTKCSKFSVLQDIAPSPVRSPLGTALKLSPSVREVDPPYLSGESTPDSVAECTTISLPGNDWACDLDSDKTLRGLASGTIFGDSPGIDADGNLTSSLSFIGLNTDDCTLNDLSEFTSLTVVTSSLEHGLDISDSTNPKMTPYDTSWCLSQMGLPHSEKTSPGASRVSSIEDVSVSSDPITPTSIVSTYESPPGVTDLKCKERKRSLPCHYFQRPREGLRSDSGWLKQMQKRYSAERKEVVRRRLGFKGHTVPSSAWVPNPRPIGKEGNFSAKLSTNSRRYPSTAKCSDCIDVPWGDMNVSRCSSGAFPISNSLHCPIHYMNTLEQIQSTSPEIRIVKPYTFFVDKLSKVAIHNSQKSIDALEQYQPSTNVKVSDTTMQKRELDKDPHLRKMLQNSDYALEQCERANSKTGIIIAQIREEKDPPPKNDRKYDPCLEKRSRCSWLPFWERGPYNTRPKLGECNRGLNRIGTCCHDKALSQTPVSSHKPLNVVLVGKQMGCQSARLADNYFHRKSTREDSFSDQNDMHEEKKNIQLLKNTRCTFRDKAVQYVIHFDPKNKTWKTVKYTANQPLTRKTGEASNLYNSRTPFPSPERKLTNAQDETGSLVIIDPVPASEKPTGLTDAHSEQDISKPKLKHELSYLNLEQDISKPKLELELSFLNPKQTISKPEWEQEISKPKMDQEIFNPNLEQKLSFLNSKETISKPTSEQKISEPKLDQEIFNPNLEQELSFLNPKQDISKPDLEQEIPKSIRLGQGDTVLISQQGTDSLSQTIKKRREEFTEIKKAQIIPGYDHDRNIANANESNNFWEHANTYVWKRSNKDIVTVASIVNNNFHSQTHHDYESHSSQANKSRQQSRHQRPSKALSMATNAYKKDPPVVIHSLLQGSDSIARYQQPILSTSLLPQNQQKNHLKTSTSVHLPKMFEPKSVITENKKSKQKSTFQHVSKPISVADKLKADKSGGLAVDCISESVSGTKPFGNQIFLTQATNNEVLNLCKASNPPADNTSVEEPPHVCTSPIRAQKESYSKDYYNPIMNKKQLCSRPEPIDVEVSAESKSRPLPEFQFDKKISIQEKQARKRNILMKLSSKINEIISDTSWLEEGESFFDPKLRPTHTFPDNESNRDHKSLSMENDSLAN